MLKYELPIELPKCIWQYVKYYQRAKLEKIMSATFRHLCLINFVFGDNDLLCLSVVATLSWSWRSSFHTLSGLWQTVSGMIQWKTWIKQISLKRIKDYINYSSILVVKQKVGQSDSFCPTLYKKIHSSYHSDKCFWCRINENCIICYAFFTIFTIPCTKAMGVRKKIHSSYHPDKVFLVQD